MRGSCDALCGCRDVSRSRSLRSALVIAIAKVARRRCARSIVSVRFASGGESFALRSRSSGCRATRTGRAIGMRDRGRRRIASVGFAAIAIGSRRKRALVRFGPRVRDVVRAGLLDASLGNQRNVFRTPTP